MSICGTPLIHRPIPAQESIFCAELAQLPLPERARRIDLKLRETRKFLGARNEKLLALRGDFDALTLDFWRRFARGLGCEDPERTIAAQKERMRSIGHISIILFTIAMTGLAAARAGAIPELVVFIGVAEVVTLCVIIGAPLRRISRAQEVIIILGREQEPFWLIGGSIASTVNRGSMCLTKRKVVPSRIHCKPGGGVTERFDNASDGQPALSVRLRTVSITPVTHAQQVRGTN
jgi:hypothetical protein